MRINYSCVVDVHEKFKKQGWLWLNSLIKSGGVNPADIWVHCINGMDAEYIKKCESTGVNVRVTEPFGDKKYCNKIPQISNKELKESDVIILMDTDMLILENFENRLNADSFTGSGCIAGKIVDIENPPTHVIDAVFGIAGLKKTLPDKFTERGPVLTYGANFNGGLYIIPRKYYDIIETGWKKWALWLLENGKPMYEAKKAAHIDQIAFCMTVHEHELDIRYLDRVYNYPMTYDFGADERTPYVLHYHEEVDANFLLSPAFEPLGNIKKAVDRANAFISENI